MQLFYDPAVGEGNYQLREEEAKHAFRVLRKRPGDVLDLVDGRGGWFKGTVVSIDKRSCVLGVSLVGREARRADFSLQLQFAPTKNMDRIEWLVEKATEIGVDVLQPILTEHTERTRLRIDRLERIAVSAMKQCERAWVPEIRRPLPFAEVLPQPAAAGKYLPYLGEADSPLLHAVARPRRDTLIAIGPEGGFSQREAEAAKSFGYRYVSLGPNRLRTETAAIAALHTINQLNW